MTLMDVKKSQSPSNPSIVSPQGVRNFVGDVKDEIGKVTWTSKEELQTYTRIVIAATFLFGMGIFTVDLCIQTALEGLGNVLRLLIG